MNTMNLDQDTNILANFLNRIKMSFPDEKIGSAFNSKNVRQLKYTTILCRAFRQVDDKGKRILQNFIDFKNIHVDDLYYIIIYQPEMMQRFIELCKGMRRLFFLDELLSYLEKIDQTDDFKTLLLKNNLLIYKYEGLEKLCEIEREEIMAQRACYLDMINSQ